MNKFLKILLAAALVITFAVAVPGCAGSRDPDAQVASVNNTRITQSDLDAYTALDVYTQGYDLTDIKKSQEQTCLDNMVDAEVIRQYYEKTNAHIYDDSYNSQKDEYVNSLKSQNADFIDQSSITDKDIIVYFRSQYLRNKFLGETQAEHDAAAIQQEARKYYDSHKKDYKVENEKRISVILTKKKKESQAAHDRLDAGEDFAAIASELSTDSNSAASGGDLGYFTKSEIKERYGSGIFGMSTGEYSKPVKTKDGYAIIKITDSNDSGYKSYDEVSQDIIYSLYEKYNDERLDEVKKGMKIEEEKIK